MRIRLIKKSTINMKMFDLGLGGVQRLLVAAAVTAAVAGCVRYDVAIPLDRFRNVAGGAVRGSEITVSAGETWLAEGEYGSFMLKGQAFTSPGAEAALAFHTDGTKGGYEVLFRNGAIDGTRKSGSLAAVRDLYRSLAEDGKWFDFEVAVRGRNIR